MTELKGEIDNLAIIVGNLNASLSIMNMKTRQINKEMEDLTNTINWLDLTDICRILHSITAKYTKPGSWQLWLSIYFLLFQSLKVCQRCEHRVFSGLFWTCTKPWECTQPCICLWTCWFHILLHGFSFLLFPQPVVYPRGCKGKQLPFIFVNKHTRLFTLGELEHRSNKDSLPVGSCQEITDRTNNDNSLGVSALSLFCPSLPPSQVAGRFLVFTEIKDCWLTKPPQSWRGAC